MADLLKLARELQEQLDVVTKYIEKQKLPAPSFIPTGNPLKTVMTMLPKEIEQARAKAEDISGNIHMLLTSPVGFSTTSSHVDGVPSKPPPHSRGLD